MRTDDGYIIHECLNGEPEAFGVLVDKYKSGIYAFAYAKLGNFQDAQDVTQEAFLKAYRNLRSLRRWESFGFWLYRITSNLCKEWLIARSRRPDLESTEDQNPGTLDATSLSSYLENQPYKSVREAIHSLPASYREVLVLCYFGGMNSSEVSRVLGISPTAVRMRLSRARAKLREEMVAMMETAFEGQRLQSTFTFRIVEAVKRIKIHPTPRVSGLPLGLSLAMGIIVTVLSLNPHISTTSDIVISAGSPIPAESKVLKVGEIPVDVVKIFKTPIISSQQDKGKGGGKLTDPQNVTFLAPQEAGNIWKKKADMPTARDSLSTSVVNGKIYAIGGMDANLVSLTIVEEYNPVTDKWMEKADMLTARSAFSTSVVDGKIYAIGGDKRPGANCLSSVEIYDPVIDTWRKGKDMPTARRLLSTSVVNGKIYAIGGDNKFGPCLSAVEEYDPVKDTWTKKADMPTARCGLSTCVVNGEIYAIGGIPINVQAWNALSTVEVYNPAKDEWAEKTDMPTPRCVFSTCAMNGKIHAIGGALFQPSVVTPKVEVYDPATDTWEEKADMQSARGWLAASEVSGKIYAIGGSTDVDYLTAVEEYTPESWPFSVSPQGKLPTKWGREKGR